MAGSTSYKPSYENSWAMVIGINAYLHASPLLFAKNDAEGVKEILQTKFGFSASNILTLFDGAATSDAIRKAYLSFADDKKIGPDDRLVVFFAGHGHTSLGKRGEVGFLVPSNGDPTDMSTLIRWDELTRNAEFIPAKHIFFVMDACYGGLALQRQPSFGSMRFLSDMLQRYARQVLTAGKPDEPVSDGNGVRPGHSLFTAHFLNALDGAASTERGIITASGVMAYVYDKVGKDQYSKQTPHYGFLDGDGDFIFSLPPNQSDSGKEKQDSPRGDDDILINTSPEIAMPPTSEFTISDLTKMLLSDPAQRIKLDDFISQQIRAFLAKSDLRFFPVQPTSLSPENITQRVEQYELVTKDIQHVSILLAKWAEGNQTQLLEKIFTRLVEADKGAGGLVAWLELTWYPLLLLMYSVGISALASQNYQALRTALLTRVQPDPERGVGPKPLVASVIDHVWEISEVFKSLPGSERKYVPISEHVFKAIQPALEDELLLGRSYEAYFDQFEILIALTYLDTVGEGWGPPGRFAWKQSRGYGTSPMAQMLSEAKMYGPSWGPLTAGLFSSSYERLLELANQYSELIKKFRFF